MSRSKRPDLYDRIRADVITLWRKASKRHMFSSAFVVLATVHQTSPGLLEALLAKVMPGLSLETATMLVAAAVLSGTRLIDKRKAAPDAQQ